LDIRGIWFYLPSGVGAVSKSSWIGFLYVSLISQLNGFFAGYSGLSIGDTALVSQTQLLQAFLTVSGSAIYMHEAVTAKLLVLLGCVVVSIFISRKALHS
jgi:drug/metabolite transporter (DMT)-like permease